MIHWGMVRWHFFVRQPLHLILLVALCGGLWLSSLTPGFQVSHSWNISVPAVVVVSVVAGALHHLWVLVFWRLELGFSAVSRRLGRWGFILYSAGFVVLITARFVSVLYLAPLNGGTLPIPTGIRLAAVGIIAVFNAWGMYSVLRFFGVRRAFGLDHFDASVRQSGLVKRGAYRYCGNVMYLMIVPAFLVPCLLWGSVASLACGLFHCLFVWAHYLCTERPDMALIYGPAG